MDLEDVDLFVVERQVHEKYLVETSLANHFSGEKVDPVGRRGDEESAGLLLHPGEEESENPALLPAGLRRGDPHLDLVEPKHRGRHLFHRSARFYESAFGLTVPPGENLDHVYSVERKLEIRGDGLDGQALPAAGNPHDENTLGHDFLGQVVAQMEEFSALQQPFLETFEASDFPEPLTVRNILDDAAAIHQEPLFLEQGRQRLRSQTSVRGQGTTQCVARLVKGESLQCTRELVQESFIRIAALAARWSFPRLVPQKLHQLDQVGRPQFKKHDAPLDLLRNESHRRGDDHELLPVETALIEISK